MKKNKIFKLIFALAIFFLGAVTSEAANKGIGFEVSPIFPSSQIESNLGYYYLETKPGEKQTFEMAIFSSSDKVIEVEPVIENAISLKTGTIGYNSDIKKTHESLKQPITEIVKPESKVIKLKPKEQKNIKFEVTPPEESYEGAKMGRVVIRMKREKETQGVKQEFQYAVGIITANSGQPFNDGNKLILDNVKANVTNGTKVIEGEMINPQPKTIENLKVRAYVTKKGDSKKLKEKNIDNFAFAPNSKVDYTIPWGLTNFETGEYTFHFTGKNEFESFDLKKDFKIRGDMASKLNNEAAFAVKTPTIIKVIVISLNTFLIILCVVVVLRNKKWIKELKAKKKKSNRKKGKKRKK